MDKIIVHMDEWTILAEAQKLANINEVNFDVEASLKRYKKMITKALGDAFPQIQVEFLPGSPERNKDAYISNRPDVDDKSEEVRKIVNGIRASKDWVIEIPF